MALSGCTNKCSKYCKTCCIPYKGTTIVLIWSALLHSCPTFLILTIFAHFERPGRGEKEFYSEERDAYITANASVLAGMILTLLSYPITGLIAETCFNRFKVMIFGTATSISALVVLLIGVSFAQSHIMVIGLIIHNIGLGMFEANAIQFGVDQLQFASNDELSKFVHWYFWTLFAVQYAATPLMTIILSYYLFIPSSLAFSVLGLAIVICTHRQHLIIEPTGYKNPIKLIAKVTNYARKHKQPMKRSAFTYGEMISSRLDLGKERFGGPFTTEQVEDVKSFWRISGILLTLVGLSFSTNIFVTLGLNLQSLSAGSGWYWYLSNLVFDQSLFYAVIIIGVPVYMSFIRSCLPRRLSLNMLKKMGVGLLMLCIAMSLAAVGSVEMYRAIFNGEVSLCFNNTVFGECELNQTDGAITITALLTAEVFGAIGYTLVFLSALEFILAQAPRSMQSFLIGLWYAYQSFGLVFQLFTFLFVLDVEYWPYTVRVAVTFISMLLFFVVSYLFQYRQRDEPSHVNYQSIIEEYTDRQLQAKDKYLKRQLSFIVEDENDY